ncbi:MAG: hypothetical protein RIC56_14740 [Pseudomonadales bacterium]
MTRPESERPAGNRRGSGAAALALLLVFLGATARAAEPAYVDAWGPAVGSELPLLEALDQDGERRTLADLSGRQGLLLFLNRSADW